MNAPTPAFAVMLGAQRDHPCRTMMLTLMPRRVEVVPLQAKGWTVDPRYIYVDDAVSGAEWKHRPGFNALVAALVPRPPFGVLVVSELSRIGRDTVRTSGVLQIEEAGVETVRT